jgi:hypothetical protein
MAHKNETKRIRLKKYSSSDESAKSRRLTREEVLMWEAT